jgi:hypothetical protein
MSFASGAGNIISKFLAFDVPRRQSGTHHFYNFSIWCPSMVKRPASFRIFLLLMSPGSSHLLHYFDKNLPSIGFHY